MQSTTYEFPARGKLIPERPRLMSAWTLAGFAVVVLIPLVMTFPKQELLQQASQQRLGDMLTVNYLTNLLKTEPGNLELRMLLAEHQIFLGTLEDIPSLIEPALKSSDPAWQAKGLLAEYKYLTKQFLLSPKNSAQRTELMERRKAVFLRLSGRPWPIPTLVYLAGQADELHERAISSMIYQTILDSSATVPVSWFVVSANHYLAEGNYALAAHLYFIARHREHAQSKQREYLLAGLRAMLSGGLYEQAMREMDEHVGNLEDDPETLYALIQAARAANDQSRAVRYAKRLLHLSRLENTPDRLQQFGLALLGISYANAAADQPESSVDGIRPYNEKNYQLAYEVFIGNGNLAEAFRVAQAAVRQVPTEAVWHKRLAQVAEWTNKPEIALREWRWLSNHGGGQEALLAVLRLAPALNDYDALLEAWQRVASKQKLNAEQWNNLAGLFEQTGRQRAGIKFFEQRYAADHLPLQLEIAARLAERSGDDAHANALYSRLLERHGFNSGWLMKIANLYLSKGEYQKAYDLLQKNRGKVDANDLAYWKVLADLAWQLQRDSDATKSYRRMAEAGNLAREDFSRLIYLLGDSQQEEKAALAEMAYRRFGDRDMLLRALEIYAAKKDLLAQKRLFESAANDGKVDLSDSSRYYLLRAQYLQASGEFQAARADFRHAAALAPDDVNTGNAMLWFLIDAHDLPALREMIANIVARGEQQNPAYWGALAAAYQVLDQPSRAVAYYTRQLKQGGQDFLWLVNYADALEQAQQAGMAERVRRHAWLQLREQLSGKPVKLPYSQDMLAAARLAMLNYPNDPGLALVRSVLRQDRLLDRDAVTDRKANELELGWATALNEHDAAAERMASELVLGWAISKEQSANAKAWLWRRYGQALSRPLWAEASVAMAENDTAHIESLLAGQADGMPMLVRHDAANAVEQVRYAQSIVFEGLTDNPDSNEAHLRLSEDVLAGASFVNLELKEEKLGSLHRHIQSTQVEMPVAHNMRLAAEFTKAHQSSDELPLFGSVPPTERVAGVVLKNHGSLGNTEIALRRRNEFAGTTESHVLHETNILPRINLQLGAELHAPATVSTDYLVFGMRNQFTAGLLYSLSKREYLRVEPGWARYYTQTGDFLGSGRHFSWELGHKIRAEYPDWKVRVIGIHTRFNNSVNATLPLPSDVNIYGLCSGFGEVYQQAYTQAWRPYLDYCATHNDVSGQGYNAMLGLAGSVAGHDQLSLTLRQERGGANVVNGLTHQLNLNYRYFID